MRNFSLSVHTAEQTLCVCVCVCVCVFVFICAAEKGTNSIILLWCSQWNKNIKRSAFVAQLAGSCQSCHLYQSMSFSFSVGR